MSFRVAILGLTLHLALAEPGSLRGLGSSRSRNATSEAVKAALPVDVQPAANATPEALHAITANATPEAEEAIESTSEANESTPEANESTPEANVSFAGNLTEAALLGVQVEEGVSEVSASLAGELAHSDALVASGAAAGWGATYFDGECHPCPAYLYKHCSRFGGHLVGTRRCGAGGAFCEGQCAGGHSPPPVSIFPASHRGVMTLYHETSPEIAEKILATGFRPGRYGLCGGAIYFYWSPAVPRTKLGPYSHHGAVIQARVNLGWMAKMDWQCHGQNEVRRHYDSLTFNPGDGDEYVIFNKNRVISMRRYS